MLPLQIEEPGLEMFLKNVFQCCCSLLWVVELFEICFYSTWLFKKLLVEHTALLVELLWEGWIFWEWLQDRAMQFAVGLPAVKRRGLKLQSCKSSNFAVQALQCKHFVIFRTGLKPSLCLSVNKGWSHEAFAVKGLKLSASLVHAFSVHCRFYVKDTQAHKPHKHTTYTFHCISKHIQRNNHYHKQGFWRKPDIIVEASNI